MGQGYFLAMTNWTRALIEARTGDRCKRGSKLPLYLSVRHCYRKVCGLITTRCIMVLMLDGKKQSLLSDLYKTFNETESSHK